MLGWAFLETLADGVILDRSYGSWRQDPFRGAPILNAPCPEKANICGAVGPEASRRGSPGGRVWRQIFLPLVGVTRDRGAWWAAIYGVAQSRTRLKRLSSSSSSSSLLGFPGDSVVKNLLANAGDMGLIPGSGRSPGGWTEEPGGVHLIEHTHSSLPPWVWVYINILKLIIFLINKLKSQVKYPNSPKSCIHSHRNYLWLAYVRGTLLRNMNKKIWHNSFPQEAVSQISM